MCQATMSTSEQYRKSTLGSAKLVSVLLARTCDVSSYHDNALQIRCSGIHLLFLHMFNAPFCVKLKQSGDDNIVYN